MNYKNIIIFVVSLLVIVAIGVTAYYFTRPSEVITVDAKYAIIEMNKGERLGIKAEVQNPMRATTITFASEDEEILSVEPGVEYNEAFIVAKKAGHVKLILKSNKPGWEDKICNVYIGDGDAANPYFIKTPAELAKLGTLDMPLDRHYKLIADIDLVSIENWTPIGATNAFGLTGSFDGNGHTIFNTNINGTSSLTNIGFFAKIGNTGQVSNLTIKDSIIDIKFDSSVATAYVGLIAGRNLGTIKNCYVVDGSITFDNAGVAIINAGSVAGIVGDEASTSTSGLISRVAVNNTKIIFKNTGVAGYVGGLAAKLVGGTIKNSYFIGQFDVAVANVYSAGLVEEIKGIVSTSYKAIVKDCYAVVTYADGKTAANCSGIIRNNITAFGQSKLNIILGCYFDKNVSGDLPAVRNSTSLTDGIVAGGLTTIEFATYTNLVSYIQGEAVLWNFMIVWKLDPAQNGGYPILMMAVEEDDPILNPADENYIVGGGQLSDDINNDIENGVIKSYQLANNITLTGSWTPIGTRAKPFKGIIEGNGYSISGLVIDGDFEGIGLFGFIEDAIFRNITIIAPQITGRGVYTGALVGCDLSSTNGKSRISNCKVIGATSGTRGKIQDVNYDAGDELYIGGLAGYFSGTTSDSLVEKLDIIVDKTNAKTVRLGGIIGAQRGGAIYNTSASVEIDSHNVAAYAGGIAGLSESTNVQFSTYKGAIVALNSNTNTYVGGIVGSNTRNSEISLCSARGELNGYFAGGIAGYNDAYIKTSFVSNMKVSGERVGGFVAVHSRGTIDNCYTLAELYGLSGSSVKAGAAVEVAGGNVENAIIHTCFIATTFTGLGESYTETKSEIRYSNNPAFGGGGRRAGYIYGSIYDADLAGSAKTQVLPGALPWDIGSWFGGSSPNKGNYNGTNYDNIDGRKATGECKTVAPFTNDNRNFSSGVWNLGNDSYPTLKSARSLLS